MTVSEIQDDDVLLYDDAGNKYWIDTRNPGVSPRIVVYCWGGVVQSVMANRPDIEAMVVDHDNAGDGESFPPLDENDNPTGFEGCVLEIA